MRGKNINLLTPNMVNIVLFTLFCTISITNSQLVSGDLVAESSFNTKDPQSVPHSYDRFDEVLKKCSSILNSSPDLLPDDNLIYEIKKELSFVNGDWWQIGNNEAPLMPFNNRFVSMNISSGDLSPLKLASFWVTDVARSQPSKKYINISGILQIGITLGNLFDNEPYNEKPRFDIYSGLTQLSVIFQGIYTENSENSGERIVCLLGEAMLPSRYPDSSDPWEWVRESGFTNQPPLLQDENILFILRYPKKFSLINRAIRGSMSSLNPKTNLKYFDEVHITSSLRDLATYNFGSEKFVCSPSYENTSMGSDIDSYKGLDFCTILQRTSRGDGFTFVSNWKCNGTDEYCSKLGPFSSDKNINATDGGFKNVRLMVQDVRCKDENIGNGKIFKVSSVFRVVDPFEDPYSAMRRTGLNNMTLLAEGEWNSSNGKLCMVGCIGFSNICNSSIILYIPLQFSIKQRSIIMGTISSTDKSNLNYFPLSFEMLLRQGELWDQYTTSRPYYKYSKIDLAVAVLEKDQPFSASKVIKKSFLNYPKVEKTEFLFSGLSNLAEDLTLQTSASPSKTYIQLEIISIGTLFGRYWSYRNGTNLDEKNPYENRTEYTEKQLLLNVSAQLTLSPNPENNITSVFLEGIYDEHIGSMYLIGCIDVRASWKILYESSDLENGLDCLVEAIISYPPTTARWLVNPTARIYLSSQRNEDDPLYFKQIKFETFPIMYRRQREDILSRRGVEGVLRILTLSIAIACILSQVFYIRENSESVPFISIVMLGVQAIGYSLPLITGAEAIFKGEISESYDNQFSKSQWIQVIDYTVKLLVLFSFLINLRLFQKVWKSRIRLLMRAPLEPRRVPSDKRVVIVTAVIHIIGYIIILVIHYMNISQKPISGNFIDVPANSRMSWGWATELEEYMGLVHDLFLLPQIIGNFIWQIDSKPLRKSYFMGLTLVRVLPHMYDLVKSPIPNPYFSQEYEFVNPRRDFYSKFGDIVIPVMGVVFAVIVYAQQRWKYEKLREILSIGNIKLLPLGTNNYERLSSKSIEAELVAGANNRKREDEDEDSD